MNDPKRTEQADIPPRMKSRLSGNIRLEIRSNDLGFFWDQLADSSSIFVVAEFFLMIRIFGGYTNM